ncbi:Rrf2 family transcriptional regulator [Streptomyces sp. NPDC007903]|uniref:Rrf2 family transcriptional regulator n=1 Tax=Streptomyces sp. NPDC007903 TaxID=3364786 RepID=UPI0036ED4B2E
MSANSKMSIAVHVLAWMALDRLDEETIATSQRIADSVNTNPVVIRRCLMELRDAGIVHGRRGAKAGWTLAREPESITLRDVYGAVEGNGLFALHRTPPNETCPVGFGIRPVLNAVYTRLDDAVRDELAAISIADVLRDVQAERRVAG